MRIHTSCGEPHPFRRSVPRNTNSGLRLTNTVQSYPQAVGMSGSGYSASIGHTALAALRRRGWSIGDAGCSLFIFCV